MRSKCKSSAHDVHILILHWLTVRKTEVLVWKCLNSEAPRLLLSEEDLCVVVALTEGHQRLRSASSGYLMVPRT